MKKMPIVLCVLILLMLCSAASNVNTNYRQKLDLLQKKVDSLELRINEIEALLSPKQLVVSGDTKKLIEYWKKENLNFKKISVGQYGYINKIKVNSVVDKNNVVVTITQVEPTRVVDSFNRPVYLKETVWIKGIDTSGFVDDHSYDISAVFKITGTIKDQSMFFDGNTMYLLEPVND